MTKKTLRDKGDFEVMKRISTKKSISAVLALAMLASCGGGTFVCAAKKPSAVKSLTVKSGNKKSIKIKANGYKIKKVKAKSSNSKNVKVIKSSKKAVTIKGIKGSAKIRITVKAAKGKKTKSFKLITKVKISVPVKEAIPTAAPKAVNTSSVVTKAPISTVAPSLSTVTPTSSPDIAKNPITVSKETFGKTSDGKEVSKYTLSNENNMTVSFLDYGAIIQSVKVPDRNGKIDDVVLGYDDLASYESNPNFFGAFLGRHANRIAFAYFELNGEEYKLEKNDGGRNNLHGGSPGYYKVMYDAEIGEDCVTFSRLSPDGEQGFPGNLDVKVTYRLTNENELKIEYNTKALDKDTLCNLSNHSYFNLKGHNNGDITDHKVMIKANAITETNRNSIPTGELMSVEGTPFDFRNPALVGDGLKSDNQYIKNSNGYDHNFVLDKEDGVFDKVAEITEDTSGRKMEVYTDLPGLQFYTGNYVSGTGKEGAVYGARSGMCFETQFFPDSINQPNFKQCILRAGQEFNSTTIYKFSV